MLEGLVDVLLDGLLEEEPDVLVEKMLEELEELLDELLLELLAVELRELLVDPDIEVGVELVVLEDGACGLMTTGAATR